MKQELQFSQSVMDRFAKLRQKQKLAHAYLFIGPAFIGKKETALGVAKLLNCEQGDQINAFCDQCSSCLKINAGSHPDIHLIESDFGETIKIDQVRNLIAQAKLRPFEATKKIFIMQNIENLTVEGANALLKVLEEPTASSLLILTTSMLEKNLDTVKSRCHYMYFLPPSKDNLATNLQTYYDVESSDAHFLSLFVEGCLGKALKLKDQGILKTKDEIIDQFILSSSGDAFLKEIFNDKEKIKEFLEVIFSWVRDAVLVKVGVEDGRLIHRDRLNELKSFQQGFTFEELERLKEEIVHTFKLLAENLNVKMPLLIIKERLQYG